LARYVVCILGNFRAFDDLKNAITHVGGAGFELDEAYSTLRPDPRMTPSFQVCMDRVAPSVTALDEAAIAQHKAVAYVLSPHMPRDGATAVAERVLALIKASFEIGAVAVKIESSGIAHGRARWIELATAVQKARASNDVEALSRALYTAVVRRPIHDAD